MRKSELNLLIIIFVFLVVIYTLSNLAAITKPTVLFLYLAIYFIAIGLLLRMLLSRH